MGDGRLLGNSVDVKMASKRFRGIVTHLDVDSRTRGMWDVL